MTPNWSNRTLWTGDNLDVMRGMNSGAVDLIYLDPPFNSNRDRAAPIGSEAAGAAFRDTWTPSDVDEAWRGEIADRDPTLYAVIDAAGRSHGKAMKSYLIMMAVRLMEMRRLLKETGSIYLHCDPTASHYLKMLMDAVFGRRNFLNEIVWLYRTGGVGKRWFGRKHDTILFYAKTPDYRFHPQKEKSRLSHGYGFSNVEIHRDERGPYTLVGMRDHWDVPALRGNQPEAVGYPTQKPLALLDRIVKASSSEGDVVLDPFAGCATACVAAELLGREWVGIDVSPLAAKLVKSRLRKAVGPSCDVRHRKDVPRRADLGELPDYRTRKHVLYGVQEGLCAGCRVLFPFRDMTVDHVVPRSGGGNDRRENLQLLCAACISMKGARPQEECAARPKKKGPRR